MPSPLIHASAGYAIYSLLGLKTRPEMRQVARLGFIAALTFSLLPDLDFVLGILSGSLAKVHNSYSHSLFTGIFVAAVIGYMTRFFSQVQSRQWFWLSLFCYETHVCLDFFTVGRGVMLFWPFSFERFSSPTKLFYGLHWSDGIWTSKHLLTFASEMIVVIPIVFLIRHFQRRGFENQRNG